MISWISFFSIDKKQISKLMITDLNPNDLSRPNGHFFGFPYPLEASKIVFFPVPWDVTTSYHSGAAKGPEAILQASLQVEWHDFQIKNAWQIGHGTIPINLEIFHKNQALRVLAERIINHQVKGGTLADNEIKTDLYEVNQGTQQLNQWVYEQCRNLLQENKLIGLIGGDHSVPLGLMQALANQYDSYGILHIDAHSDLRNAFEGFQDSHASIMYNARKIENITHFVAVGIRDLCEEELNIIDTDSRFTLFDDWHLKSNKYQGTTWAQQCQKIIKNLPQNVYISFDIDGLDPQFCPHTGTPVPGGLDFNQSIYLIETLVKSGRNIISFDLCEVAPGNDEWDGNVGARLLYKLANLMYASWHPEQLLK